MAHDTLPNLTPEGYTALATFPFQEVQVGIGLGFQHISNGLMKGSIRHHAANACPDVVDERTGEYFDVLYK